MTGPYGLPSTMNCTFATPWLSLAVALSVTEPATVAVFSGDVTVAVGGTMSTLNTLTTTGADVVTLPTRSRATAVRVWLPFDVSVEFHDTLYGLAVSSAP